MTVRDLAIQISVNKNTAARMLRQISASDPDARRLLLRLDDYLQTMFLAMKGQQNE